MAGLDAVFFDIDDTLYSSTEFAERARERSIQAMIRAGLRLQPERIRALLQDVISEYSSNFPYQFDEVLLRVGQDSYHPVNPAVIVASAVVAYHDTKFSELKPFEDVPVVLPRLRSRGVRMGIVTSGIPVKQAEKLIRLRLIEFFEPSWIFISEQLELSKEDPALWKEILRRSGLQPGRALYVGDNPMRDIDPPSSAGWITVLVRRGGKYGHLAGTTQARHEISDLFELEHILEKEYGM